MSLLDKIFDKILIDKEIYENRYWTSELEIDKIIIKPNIAYYNVVFMGELFHKDNINSYFIILSKKYPVKITYNNYPYFFNGIFLCNNRNYIIEIDMIKFRKWKIDILLLN